MIKLTKEEILFIQRHPDLMIEFEDFVYSACLQDWRRVGKRTDKIARRFERGKEVWLKGEGVDLRFSIKGKSLATQ